MSYEFDIKAGSWDSNPMHFERSSAIVNELLKVIPLTGEMTGVEIGAGTGITSFLLKEHLKEITMIDNSAEMVRIMNEKISDSRASNLKALLFDLEKNNWRGPSFDIALTLMALHHIADTNTILLKFSKLLKPGGYLAIADLYPEDGSFHGKGFEGHPGFNPEELSDKLLKLGFVNASHRKCFVINKMITESLKKQFDVFLLTAIKGELNT